jgi:uncharacterized SAM-binding protein YcdF (DUF218 family)
MRLRRCPLSLDINQDHSPFALRATEDRKRGTMHRKKRLFLFASVPILFLVLALFHRPLLSVAASLWIVESNDFEKVDLVLIPGGNFDTRPFGAAELYHAGRAERLAVFKTEVHPTVKMELRPPDHEICLAVLDRLKVPREDIISLGDGVTSTWDEVAATRAWCLENKPGAIAIVTEIFSSRRIRYAYRKGLAGLPVDIHVVALPALGYTAADWWRHENGLIAFQNEVVKWIIYRMR